MFVIMRFMGRRNCTKRDFSKESHLFKKKQQQPYLVKNYRPVGV